MEIPGAHGKRSRYWAYFFFFVLYLTYALTSRFLIPYAWLPPALLYWATCCWVYRQYHIVAITFCAIISLALSVLFVAVAVALALLLVTTLSKGLTQSTMPFWTVWMVAALFCPIAPIMIGERVIRMYERMSSNSGIKY